jgi:hypothetical protein
MQGLLKKILSNNKLACKESAMTHPTSALKLAARTLVICLAVCGLVIAFDPGAVRDPIRLAVMIFVVVAVPIGNYMLARRSAQDAG